MADGTGIEWTDATWPIVQGCDYESPGCAHCYVPRTLWRLMHNPNPVISGPIAGLVRKHDNGMPIFTGKLALREDRLDWPLHWKKPRRIFVPSHGDLFHEGVPFEFIDRVFAIMETSERHTFQVLTKRSDRMKDYVTKCQKQPFRNVWLGVSCEDRDRLYRLDDLRSTPAGLRFVSFEPLLGDLGVVNLEDIDWAIAGNESGPRRRPGDLAWMRSLRDQCAASGTKFFGKQDDKVKPLPSDLMIREMPT